MKESQHILQMLAAVVVLLLGSLFIPDDTSEERTSELLVGEGYVQRVIDGDTLDVVRNGEVERIRLIGIDTPESVDPRKQVECFGKEASAHLQSLLEGQHVTVEQDPTQGEKDVYGRTLAYVLLDDGTNVAEVMLRDGYAYEYLYRTPYTYRDQFVEAQTVAQQEERGLWSPDTCNGER